MAKRRVSCLCAAAPLALLAACGGGGSGGGVISTPTPPSTPAPTPAPTPTPTPSPGTSPTPLAVPAQFNTTEFRRSDGPLQHNAASAWSAGATGAGVTIAVIDSGIDEDSPEFAGRISANSRDMYPDNRPLTGLDDHGTSVAMVAAAARNSTGILGMAFDAKILALRSDEPGSCGMASSPIAKPATECQFPDDIIAQAVSFAAQKGAKVINLSLGGDDGASQMLKGAVAGAVASGALVVISAGNDGAAQVSSFAGELDQVANGGVLIVGSVNRNGVISDFSDRAGSHAAHYLTARGEEVCCVYDNGQIYLEQGSAYVMSGTSFSAPQVAGAAALLAQAFPNLTGRQIAQILLQSAFDAGAAGSDPIYGQGILDIAKAMQPSGITTLAGSTTAVALSGVSGTTSAAMGDALASASLPAVVLDEYQRAYQADLAGTLRGASPAARLGAAIGAQTRNVVFGSPRASLAFAIDERDQAGMPQRIAPLRLSRADADRAEVLAARIALALDPRSQLAVGYREGADGLAAQLQGQSEAAFLLAPSAASDASALNRADVAFAARRQIGPWGLTVSSQQGRAVPAVGPVGTTGLVTQSPGGTIAQYALGIDRRFGALETALGVTWQAESETLLGGRLHDAFGAGGAATTFLDARVGWTFAPRLRLGAALREGFTHPDRAGLVASGERLEARAWALDLTRQGVFTKDDTLALRLSQPLRIEHGALDLSMPVGWNYATSTASYGLSSLNLAPHGRELIGELAWRGRLLGGSGAASLFYRRDPGHYEQVADDKGAALRWSAKF